MLHHAVRFLAAALLACVMSASASANDGLHGATPVHGKAHAKSGKAKAPKSFDSKPAVGTRASCPVSGEQFTVTEKTQTSTHDGRVYAFCCADCKADFDKDPAKYAEKK